MAKRALGKGLDALISDTLEPGVVQENVLNIKIQDIVPNKDQPRRNFDESGIRELALSIKENGLIQPVVVRKNGDKYELIVGERRYKAVKKAGLTEIPAFVKDYSDDKLIELALIENIQREDLNAIEEALAFKNILERDMITQEELSKRVGKSRSYIANMIRILELPKTILDHVSRGTISVGQAKALLSLGDSSEQEEIAKKIIDEPVTVRELEGIVRKRSVPRGTKKKELDPFIEDIEEKLRDRFSTKVKIDYKGGKGQIKIDFYSNEELERIVEEIFG
jgi:ParB family chromosome partitioning protein